MKCNLYLFTFIVSVFISCAQNRTFDVRDFGAVNDSTVVSTEAIQAAIDECAAKGGGEVCIKEGTYVSGTLLLKDNVELNIANDAKLLASTNPNDFYSIDAFIDATGQYRGQCLIGAIDVENVAITGKGVIDGRGAKFSAKEIKETLKKLGQDLVKEDYSHLISENNRYVNNNIRYGNRPFLIRLVRAQNVTLKDITLRQPAAWTLHFYQCNGFLVDGIEIYSHANRNNDGIDIDSSTDGVIINSHINSGDDAICVKATSSEPVDGLWVENCKLSSHWGAIKFGTESMGDFKNITIKNCHIYDNKGGGIKILSVDGSNIQNVLIDSITMDNVDMPIFIRLGERGLIYRDAKPRPVGSIENVRISNVIATARSLDDSRVVPPSGIFITGTQNHKIGNVSLSNIEISLPGGGSKADAAKVVPENETMYPEFTMFEGCVPAYGLYARHINELHLENLQFKITGKDERREIMAVDANIVD